MQDLEQWATQYLSACEHQSGLDPKTLKAYRIDLKQFIAFTTKNSAALDRDEIMKYICELHLKYMPRTIRRKIASIKAFCGFLEYYGLIENNPFDKLRLKLNTPMNLPRTIALTDIEAILAAAYQVASAGGKATAFRDVAVLELLFATGIRVSELCTLKPEDVRLEQGEVIIYGKGAKERYVQIANPAVLKALETYRMIHAKLIEECGIFFINRSGRPLSDQSVRGIIKKYTKLAGLTQHITPHMFRHSFATLLLEEGVDIRYIQRLLGHSSIVTTQIYTHVAGKKQRDILAAKHPRNQLNFH